MSKIIILRGNAGSGKSSVAQDLQARLEPRPLLIEHDHFRRHILKERETPDILNDKLILHTIEFALKHNKDVIFEGILPLQHSHQKYRELLAAILAINSKNTYIYWFDIPFQETVKRHSMRTKALEFGEEKLKQWYKDDDRSHMKGEIIIKANMNLERIVQLIADQAGLKLVGRRVSNS